MGFVETGSSDTKCLTTFQSNVLVMENGTACLSDFGLSGVISEFFSSSNFSSSVSGNIRWGAPELFALPDTQDGTSINLPSKEADIYSFGSIMLQVCPVPLHGHPLEYIFISGPLGEGSLLLYQASVPDHCNGSGWKDTQTPAGTSDC